MRAIKRFSSQKEKEFWEKSLTNLPFSPSFGFLNPWKIEEWDELEIRPLRSSTKKERRFKKTQTHGQTSADRTKPGPILPLKGPVHRYRKAKIDCLRFVMCPLLAQLEIGFFSLFSAAAVYSTNEANKAGLKQSIIFRCLWACTIKLFMAVMIELRLLWLNQVHY